MTKVEELEDKLAFAVANGGPISAIKRDLANAKKEEVVDEEVVNEEVVNEEVVNEEVVNEEVVNEEVVEFDELVNAIIEEDTASLEDAIAEDSE